MFRELNTDVAVLALIRIRRQTFLNVHPARSLMYIPWTYKPGGDYGLLDVSNIPS